ncbi:hypothetical protein NP233_g1068 [Leucocoprinus birnbaumii]|uniref:Nephrocystin 3-like N-terminal domain-containing protein n=1 Tax=Leucocoprinus birnbaumii TaxID=56174 RepID=A0AAD5W4P4_9AGAR|nr:hypothetical protein NP233_g1068 [Leucocoprinus birnbaumii]
MPTFENAQNTIVNGGQFTDVNINNFTSTGLTGIDILLEASVPDAAVDAEARQYAPSCFPGTREQYIEDITRWATIASSDEQSPPIYWMKGPAGVGKSAVAQTSAERLLKQGQLGGAYFFSINGREDHTCFFTTIAYQLATLLVNYRIALNNAIINDKTLVKKTMSSQFDALIAAPLRLSQESGEIQKLQRKTIIIDGLDECKSKDAQCEIIEIIAASIRNGTTPFRWAIFSRPEPHIEATFASADVAPYCRSVVLPISRQADGEIKLYLEGGFKNIFRRRNLSFLSAWPPETELQKLIDASAGLFAYPAAVLRFIDHYPSFRLEEPLRVVLAVTPQQSASKNTPSPFATLDAFYMLIMQRIPEHILPSVMLFFADMLMDDYTRDAWPVSFLCNILGLSESEFRGICGQLHAVLHYQNDSKPSVQIYDFIELSWPYYTQDVPFYPNPTFFSWLARSLGGVSFYHKSFYDFLSDPARSATFCVTTQSMRQTLFAHYIKRHLDYAGSYAMSDKIETQFVGLPQPIPVTQQTPGLDLELRRTIAGRQLSWPLESEFVCSYLEDSTFLNITGRVIHYHLPKHLEVMPPQILQKLSELDYRKYLHISLRSYLSPQWKDVVVGCPGDVVTSWGTAFYRRIKPKDFDGFDSEAFLRLAKIFEKLGVIKPHRSKSTSKWKDLLHSIHKNRGKTKASGLYTCGLGEKAIFWYWEFDTERRYYREFHALELDTAMSDYKREGSNLWKDDNEEIGNGMNSAQSVEEGSGLRQAWRKLQEPEEYISFSYCGEGC